MGGKFRARKAIGPSGADRYLEQLERFSFVRNPRVREGALQFDTPDGKQHLQVEWTNEVLSYARVNSMLAERSDDAAWILMAPHVSPGVGEQLARHGGNYVDAAGNCHLQIGQRYFAHVEGKRPARRTVGHRPLRGPGLQGLLALLAEPELARATVREFAERAGVSKSTVSNLLRQLREDQRLVTTDELIQLADDLWDVFATGYAESLRPRWLHGRFRAKEQNIELVEQRFAEVLGERMVWGWGGGAAADRMTHHYHGPEVVLHVDEPTGELTRELKLLRAEHGPIVIIHTPCPAAFSGPMPHVIAPALAYAELVHGGHDRALEAARLLRQRYQGSH
jgi:hypothetical protein